MSETLQKTDEILAARRAYNETLANEHGPLTIQQVLEKGLNWQDANEQKASGYLGPTMEIPDSINDVDNSICDRILRCKQTKRPYKIVRPELQFYRKMQIPIPRLCPDARHAQRLQLRNPRMLWRRSCDTCDAAFETSYAPARPERVHCEHCYQELLFR